jgi:uncharacterized protein (TIGR00369 family)
VTERHLPSTLQHFQDVIDNQTFSAWTGVKVTHVEKGVVEIEMPMRAEFGQHHGSLHAAMFAFMADTACGYAAATELGDCVTSQYDLRLLAPGLGERFFARGEVVKAGKRLATVQARVYAITGETRKLIAIASATVMPVG